MSQGFPYSKELLLFHDKQDVEKPLFVSLTSLGNKLVSLLKKNNMPAIHMHDLRHNYATICLNNGISLKTISTLLGHTNINTTANIYCESTTEKEKAMHVVSDVIGM
ncbi:tyrosine-type recombinase/integrase [Christensenella tenuis]|uniref:Tyrosine-type recombinase/integrase n=1 Tax=Christensenella tenuis TaxID=2763033 RepID=A0ABR7EE18_9FIRM|nr:tyrosine-type recombinase/integrase [Christensenella tenuis]